MSADVRLAALDLGVLREGDRPAQGLDGIVANAVAAERAGFHRFWVAEHHVSAGLSSKSVHVLASVVANATSTIRIGSAATILANYAPIQIAEDVLIANHFSGGRFDLGLGRARFANVEKLAKSVVSGQDERLFVDLQDELFLTNDSDYNTRLAELLGYLRTGEVEYGGARYALATPSEDGLQIWIHGNAGGGSYRPAALNRLPFGVNFRGDIDATKRSIDGYRELVEDGTGRVIVSVPIYLVRDGDVAAARSRVANWLEARNTGGYWVPVPRETSTAPVDERELQGRVIGGGDFIVERLAEIAAQTGADELVLVIDNPHSDGSEDAIETVGGLWSRR